MASTSRLSKYGGTDRWTFDATGFFRVDQTEAGRWFFVDPDGYLVTLHSKG